jgi:hypothetical protein
MRLAPGLAISTTAAGSVAVRGLRASPTTAPDSVLVEPSLVRKITSRKPGIRRSPLRGRLEPRIVSQVGSRGDHIVLTFQLCGGPVLCRFW